MEHFFSVYLWAMLSVLEELNVCATHGTTRRSAPVVGAEKGTLVNHKEDRTITLVSPPFS